ncbi:MAG: hypothetical protein ABW072_18030 [Sedimenticola sp.]
MPDSQSFGEEFRSLQCKVHRYWGWHGGIDEGVHFKVKRIQVMPRPTLICKSTTIVRSFTSPDNQQSAHFCAAFLNYAINQTK